MLLEPVASEIPSGKQLLAFGTRARFFGCRWREKLSLGSISAPVYICQECEQLFVENDTASGTKPFQLPLLALLP